MQRSCMQYRRQTGPFPRIEPTETQRWTRSCALVRARSRSRPLTRPDKRRRRGPRRLHGGLKGAPCSCPRQLISARSAAWLSCAFRQARRAKVLQPPATPKAMPAWIHPRRNGPGNGLSPGGRSVQIGEGRRATPSTRASSGALRLHHARRRQRPSDEPGAKGATTLS